jgi:hypothetical protein
MAEIYVPGAIDIMGSANQMMQFRNSQQAQQANALQMQYTMEDRAREAENRKLAAGNALAARAEAQKIAKIYEQGFNPGKTAVMGPGTVQGSTEPSYDYNKTALELIRAGKIDKAEELFNLPEARRTAGAEYMEKDAKARVEALKAETETYNTALARVKPVLAQAISIDGLMHYVDVVDADPVLGPLALKTGGPTEARKEAIRKMAAPKEAGGGGMTVDQIAQRLGGIDGYALKNMDIDFQKKEAEIANQNANAAKARGEAGGGGSGGTENERLRLTLLKGVNDPAFAATPEYAAAWNASFGEKIVDMPDPNDNSKRIFQRVRVPAPEMYPRPTFKQNALAAGPAAAQPTNALAMNAGGYGGGAPVPAPQTSTAMQPIRTETGEGMLASVSAPSSARETQTITEENKKAGAKAALDFIGFDPATGKTAVDKLLPTSTSGSMEQLGADFFAAFGASTEGSEAIAQLETIASTLTLELAGGKLGAGFTDEDRRFLLNTLGDVANSKKPVQDRLAAWKTAKRYMAQKAGVTLPEDHAENATPKETTETYATAKTLVDKINASNMSQERKTELINKVYEKLTISGYDPAKVK